MTASRTQAYWNGEPVNVARGEGTVNGRRQRIVRVFYGGKQFDLDDTTGRAWAKVTAGHGSPRYGHRNVTVEPGSVEWDSYEPMIEEVLTRQQAETAEQ